MSNPTFLSPTAFKMIFDGQKLAKLKQSKKLSYHLARAVYGTCTDTDVTELAVGLDMSNDMVKQAIEIIKIYKHGR